MADSFIKPPFFQWGVKPVASRGLGEVDEGFYLRGWEVSTADVNDGRFQLTESSGFFRYTIPASFVAGDPIYLHAVGGLMANVAGVFPSSVDGFVRVFMGLGDGLPAQDVPLASTGYTRAIGTSWVTWSGLPGVTWQVEGPNPDPFTLIISDRSNVTYTLVDGAGGTPNLPNEGTWINLSGDNQPIGFAPALLAVGPPFGALSPSPGQEVGMALSLQTIPDDPINRDAKCFMYVESITMEMIENGGLGPSVFTPIDLRSITVGFGPQGSTGLPWPEPPPAGITYGNPWNPFRLIENVRPPESGRPDDGYQDLWLVGTVPPLTEDVRITSESDTRTTADGDTRVTV